jgi:hypothetical protein
MWHNPQAFPEVWKHVHTPAHTSPLLPSSETLVTKLGDPARGNVVEWFIQFESNNQTINAIHYRVYGCGFQLAACSCWSTFVMGKSLCELPADGATWLIEQLQLPTAKQHTAYLTVDAFMQVTAKLAKLKK